MADDIAETLKFYDDGMKEIWNMWSSFRENKLNELNESSNGPDDRHESPHPYFEDIRKTSREERAALQGHLKELKAAQSTQSQQRSEQSTNALPGGGAADWARQAHGGRSGSGDSANRGYGGIPRSSAISSLSTEAARAETSQYLQLMADVLNDCDGTRLAADAEDRVMTAAAKGSTTLAKAVADQSRRDGGLLDGIIPSAAVRPGEGGAGRVRWYTDAADTYLLDCLAYSAAPAKSASTDEEEEDALPPLFSVEGFFASIQLQVGQDLVGSGGWRSVAPGFMGGRKEATPVTAKAACEAWRLAMCDYLGVSEQRQKVGSLRSADCFRLRFVEKW